ncbi:MAG: polyphosphate kinase 1, partial [Anaerotignaceae bacterium]
EQHRDSKSNMTPREQLEKIYEAVRYLYEKKTIIYNEIWEGLKCYGMSKLDFKDLATTEVKYIKEYYKNNIKPVLAPQIVDAHHPFPHIANKEVYCVCLLKRKHETVFGLLPVPKSLPEIIYLPGDEIRYIRTEKIIYEYINDVFSKYEMIEKNCICITRNADISTDDETFELTEDFRSRMKKMLHKRKRLAVVRLEANYEIGDVLKEILCQKFEIHENQIFVSNTPTKMGFVFGMFDKISPAQKLQLTYKDFKPAASATFKQGQSIIKQIKQKDALMFYPYESMYSFLQLIKEAANDPAVISIKITIYRLAKKAKLVEYLCAAAENGKEVNVLMELRARFDEQNNIDWSERLEDAGCKVVYGFDEYKVHSKLCLITMKERNGISYITQVGTGNYNEKTAELYTDLSLITANTEIGLDAVEFFKNISINNVDNNYKKLLVAPLKLKNVILELIDDEIKKGSKGAIFIKINSLTDIDFIDKLREASCAGVSVKLIVRGICCL